MPGSPVQARVDLAKGADCGDFHLAAGSPAIDAALDVGVISDLEGNDRPQGAASDIGAYESTP